MTVQVQGVAQFQFLGGTGHNPNPSNFNVGDVYPVLGFINTSGQVDGAMLNKNGDFVGGLYLNDSAEWQLISA